MEHLEHAEAHQCSTNVFWIQVPSKNGYLVVSVPVIWIPEMRYERDCYLGVSRFESQTTNLPILVEFPFRQLYI